MTQPARWYSDTSGGIRSQHPQHRTLERIGPDPTRSVAEDADLMPPAD